MDNLRYGITGLGFGEQPLIEISKEEYDKIYFAKNALIEALLIEEKLDLVLENYREFEMELVEHAVNYMLFRNLNWSIFQSERNQLNRRIVNLLSSCRLYLDQLGHHIKQIFGIDTSVCDQIKKFRANEYDTCVSYRIMEALRNFVQHRGYPIHECTYEAKLTNASDGEKEFSYSLTPYILVKEIESDREFKKAVLNEMMSLGKKIDIKPHVRKYIESIVNIHNGVRDILDTQSWDSTVLCAINRLLSEHNLKINDISVGLIIETEPGIGHGIVELFSDFIARRKELAHKNKSLVRLASRFVTTQISHNA